jgi:hypothetical protein
MFDLLFERLPGGDFGNQDVAILKDGSKFAE